MDIERLPAPRATCQPQPSFVLEVESSPVPGSLASSLKGNSPELRLNTEGKPLDLTLRENR